MTIFKIYGEKDAWKAEILHSNGEAFIGDGKHDWGGLTAQITADSTDLVEKGMKFVLDTFSLGREAIIRNKTIGCQFVFSPNGQRPLHYGVLSFSYRLTTDSSLWKEELDPHAPSFGIVQIEGWD